MSGRTPVPGSSTCTATPAITLPFGFGAHQCAGQVLARLELQVVLATLFRRIPTLALGVDLGDLPLMGDGLGVGYGVYEMPVTW
ncbi:hypothetical protein GCM10022221_68850 [Actinocorallia aurea]